MTKARLFGFCALCGTRQGKAAMVPHLMTCAAAWFPSRDARSERTLLLRAQASGAPMYWLDLAAAGQAKLKDVDRLLRDVWLECCGHLSDFYGGGHREVRMNARVIDALSSVGSRLRYVYDFGSSTELVVSLSGIIGGHAGNAVQVVARNDPPAWPCGVCGEPATAVCTECVYDDEGLLCADHASRHECSEEMLLPVVNSPRMGVCSYSGEVVTRGAADHGRSGEGAAPRASEAADHE